MGVKHWKQLITACSMLLLLLLSFQKWLKMFCNNAWNAASCEFISRRHKNVRITSKMCTCVTIKYSVTRKFPPGSERIVGMKTVNFKRMCLLSSPFLLPRIVWNGRHIWFSAVKSVYSLLWVKCLAQLVHFQLFFLQISFFAAKHFTVQCRFCECMTWIDTKAANVAWCAFNEIYDTKNCYWITNVSLSHSKCTWAVAHKQIVSFFLLNPRNSVWRWFFFCNMVRCLH